MGRGQVVFLVGFMGSGKSEVGRLLAARLGTPFVDLDGRIVESAGKSVRAIFEEDGEPAFRAHERRALKALEPLAEGGLVVATGGGCWADPDNRAWMKQRGIAVWLDASIDAIEARVARDGSRPLFGDRAGLERLLEARRPAYGEAPIRVDASGPDPRRAADAIARALATAPPREAAT